MIGYRFDLTCLHCGRPLDHRADGRVMLIDGGRAETQAIAYCEPCRRPHRIYVQVTSIKAETRVLHELEAT